MKIRITPCLSFFVVLFCLFTGIQRAGAGGRATAELPGSITRPATVFWIRGGPFNNPTESGFVAQTAVRRILYEIHPEISFSSLHNNDSSELCDELKARKLSGEDFGRLIIIGHSYGGSAGTKLARCLAEVDQTVSLFLSLDIVRRLVDPNPSIIPKNVLRNLNFYQTDDPFLRGQRENRREAHPTDLCDEQESGYDTDECSDGILNVKVEMSDSSNPHHLLPNRLVELGWMHQILYDELSEFQQGHPTMGFHLFQR